eukprot:scaffold432_cov69-Cyclotella_meneghiniana.AAC.2
MTMGCQKGVKKVYDSFDPATTSPPKINSLSSISLSTTDANHVAEMCGVVRPKERRQFVSPRSTSSINIFVYSTQ